MFNHHEIIHAVERCGWCGRKPTCCEVFPVRPRLLGDLRLELRVSQPREYLSSEFISRRFSRSTGCDGYQPEKGASTHLFRQPFNLSYPPSSFTTEIGVLRLQELGETVECTQHSPWKAMCEDEHPPNPCAINVKPFTLDAHNVKSTHGEQLPYPPCQSEICNALS